MIEKYKILHFLRGCQFLRKPQGCIKFCLLLAKSLKRCLGFVKPEKNPVFWGCLLGHCLESSGKVRSSPPCVLWLWSRNAGFSEVIGKAVCAPAPTLTCVSLDCWWWTATSAQPHSPHHFSSTLFPTQSCPRVQGLLGSIWGTFLGHTMAVTEVQRDFRLFWPAVLTGNTVEGKIKNNKRASEVFSSQGFSALNWCR